MTLEGEVVVEENECVCVCVGRGGGGGRGRWREEREREWVGRGNGTVGVSERVCVGEGDIVVKELRSIREMLKSVLMEVRKGSEVEREVERET